MTQHLCEEGCDCTEYQALRCTSIGRVDRPFAMEEASPVVERVQLIDGFEPEYDDVSFDISRNETRMKPTKPPSVMIWRRGYHFLGTPPPVCDGI